MSKSFSIVLLFLSGFVLTAGIVDKNSPVISSDTIKITTTELGQKLYFTTRNKGYVIFDLKEKYSGTFTVEFKYRISPVNPTFKQGFSNLTFFIGDATHLRQDIENYYKSLSKKSHKADKKPDIINDFTADTAASSTPALYALRDLNLIPDVMRYGGLIPPMPPPRPKENTIFYEMPDGHYLGCNNYYKLHNCKWVIDFPRMTAGCSIDGYHSIKKYPIVSTNDEYFCFGAINFSGEAGNAIEISDVKIQQGVPATDAKHDVEFPRKQFREYEKDARRNDPEAMYWLGRCYYEGSFGAPKDYLSAIEWFKKAAAKKHIFAQYYLGLCYHFGRGTEIDRQKALEQFRNGLRHYYSEAEMMVYWYYAMGWWQPPAFNNTLQADIIDACGQGNANAIYLLQATQFMPGSTSHPTLAGKFSGDCLSVEAAALRGNYKASYLVAERYWNWPDKRNLAKRQMVARADFEETAKQNYPPALFRLAQLWPTEYGDKLKLSADSGYAPAMVKYGMTLFAENKNASDYLIKADAAFSGMKQGQTVAGKAELCLWKYLLKEENWKKLVNDWQSGKNASELFLAGVALEHGWGVAENKAMAYNLYLRAASSGYPPANYKLGQNSRYGITKPINFNEGRYFMELSAKAGFLPAQYELAQMCEMSGDMKNADKWYQTASEQNHSAATMRLGEKLIKSFDVQQQEKGLQYLKRAAELGEARALYYSGLAYYKGLGGLKKDATKAAELWMEYEKNEEADLNNKTIAPLWKEMPCCVLDNSEFWDKHDPTHTYLHDATLRYTGSKELKPRYHSVLKQIYCGLEDQNKVLEYFNRYFVIGIPAEKQINHRKKNIRLKKK